VKHPLQDHIGKHDHENNTTQEMEYFSVLLTGIPLHGILLKNKKTFVD